MATLWPLNLRLPGFRVQLPRVARELSLSAMARDDRAWRTLPPWADSRSAFPLLLDASEVSTSSTPPGWAADVRNPYGEFEVYSHPDLAGVWALGYQNTGWSAEVRQDVKDALPAAEIVVGGDEIVWSAADDEIIWRSLARLTGQAGRRAVRVNVAARHGYMAGQIARALTSPVIPPVVVLKDDDFACGERGGWICRLLRPWGVLMSTPVPGLAPYRTKLAQSGRAILLEEASP